MVLCIGREDAKILDFRRQGENKCELAEQFNSFF
jgi:hypothetical protein